MPPKRKAQDMALFAEKKTKMTKTVYTAVTQQVEKKSKKATAASTSQSVSIDHFQSAQGFSSKTVAKKNKSLPPAAQIQLQGSPNKPTGDPFAPIASAFPSQPFAGGYSKFARPTTASSASSVAKKKPAEKRVWLIHYKMGRHDARLMGAYTSARAALQNARAVMDMETDNWWRQRPGMFDSVNDYSSNIRAEEGVIFEAKQKDGVKHVVSFKRLRLNENLMDSGECDEEDDDGDDDDGGVTASFHGIGWM